MHFWYVSPNDWKVLRDENIYFIWSKLSKCFFFFKNLTKLKQALQFHAKKRRPCCFNKEKEVPSSNNLLFSTGSSLEHVLKRSSVNSFLTVEVDKCCKNKFLENSPRHKKPFEEFLKLNS